METNKTMKKVVVQALLSLLFSGFAAADSSSLSLLESYNRPSTYVKPGTLLGHTCRVQRLYNLCDRPRTLRQPILTPWSVLSVRASRSGQGFKLFQIASLFIDSLEIASFGDWSVRLSVEIR